MSMTLRSAASALFGVPPVTSFFRKAPARSRRVEPVMRAPQAPAHQAQSAVDMDRLMQAARRKPVNLDLIEWQDEEADAANDSAATEEAPAAPVEASTDSHSRRIRERYLSARFP